MTQCVTEAPEVSPFQSGGEFQAELLKLSINHKQCATLNMGHFPGPRSPAEPGNCDVCGWKFRGCGVSLPTAGLEA